MSSELLEDLKATTRQALTGGAGDVVEALDLAGLLVDSDRGGLGLGELEMVLVGSELGRALSQSAFLPTAVLGVTLLDHADTAAAGELLGGLIAGDVCCAVAIADVGAWTSAPAVAATSADGGWGLDGTVWGVSTPSPPSVILTLGAVDGGAALFSVDPDDAEIEPAGQLDPARGLIRVALSGAPARLLAAPAAAAHSVAAAYRRGLLAVAAEQLGVARVCLEMTVEHARTRSQFGSPIGSFQAIKHRCAEVLLDIELADAVLDQAVDSRAPVDADLAFAVATRAALSSTESCIHIHGGIGFTWEHPAHRYLRRARVNATVLGPATVHREAIAVSAGLTSRLQTT